MYNCLKSIKEQYAKEVKALVKEEDTTVRQATTDNPLSFTFNNSTLYTTQGSIDTASSWIVYSIADKDGTDLSNSGTETTATDDAPILLSLSDGDGGTKNLSIVSGSFDGSEVAANTVVTIAGGVKPE